MEPTLNPEPVSQPQIQKSNLSIPIAIVVGCALIAAALFATRKSDNPTPQAPENEEINLRAIDGTDHILGNPNAQVFVVEYSDTECPYCKTFHPTMKRIIDTYGKDGKVAWVYRHFPLYKPGANGQVLHSKAGKEAEATECAAELGGNGKFWEYIDEIYRITPSNDGLDPAELPKIAERVGLNKASFENCLNSGRYASKIDEAYEEAVAAGATGTPYNVIVTRDGKKVALPGALPYNELKPILDTFIGASN